MKLIQLCLNNNDQKLKLLMIMFNWYKAIFNLNQNK